MAANSSAEHLTKTDLILTRVFDAPRDLVFKVWTDPVHLSHWWGPAGFSNPRCEVDARPGGDIHIDMRGPDGTTFPMTGTFTELVPPERIVMRCQAHFDDLGVPQLEVVNAVTFADENGRTRLTLTATVLRATAAAAPALGGMEAGWTQSLQRLGGMMASIAVGLPTDALEREIIEVRVYDAPRDLVWRMWTEPEHVSKWWGPRSFTTTTQHMDVRPGGEWRLVMHGPDGTDYPNLNVYQEIVRPERLTYEHASAPKHHVTVLLSDEGSRTRVYMRMVFPTATELAHTVNVFKADSGLGQTMDRLHEHLASRS